MEEWKEIKASDYCQKVTDGTHDSPKPQKTGKPLVTSKHIKDNHLDISEAYLISEEEFDKIIKRSYVSQWDVIISMIGAFCGFCYLQSSTFTEYAIKNVGLFKIGNEIKSKWLYYYLNSPQGKEQLFKLRRGSSQPYLSLDSLRNILIPQPPYYLQSKIVEILSSLDEKIETNRKINARLEELAQAIFKSWLTTCKERVKLGELCNNILDYTPNFRSKVRLINSADITEGRFDNYPLVENKNLKGHFKKRFRKGDILYSEIRPRNHHYGYALIDGDEYVVSTRFMIIRNLPNKVTSSILYQYLLLPEVEADFTAKTESRSGTFPQGTYKDLEIIEVPYSSNQDYIDAILRVIRHKIFSLHQESARLAELRDALLPKLMSGEIKV